MYSAYLDIIPVELNVEDGTSASAPLYDVVGPVCETGDFLGKDRHLAVTAGDILAVCSAGAYGFTMSSNYNTRTRAAEIMVDDNQMHEVRARESFADLIKGEQLLPEN